MLAAFDIGNTNVTIGIFDGEQVRATWRIATDIERLPDEYAVTMLGLLDTEDIAPTDIDAGVMASVVPDLAPIFEQLCGRYFGVEPLVVGTGTRTGVRVALRQPARVGADRIVDVVAALHLYGPPPLIIVDFGTATVFDAVSAEGDYLGGAHRARHRHRVRGAVRARGEALPGGAGAPEERDRQEHRRRDPVRHAVRLRRA